MPYVAKMDDYDYETSEIVELEDGGWSVIGIASKYYSEDCDSGVNYYTIVHDNLSAEQLNQLIEGRYYATHCQHSYDCCGNTYTDKGKLLFANEDTALIEQRWRVNI